jgi:hypothetical protein
VAIRAVQLETEFDRRRGVTLVAARVVNDGDHARRVRVADECGSVRPPREDGVPLPGWDDGGWEGVVDAGETRALGYATPARPTDPPVAFAWTERAADGEPTTAETFADLGDPRPPRDAVVPPTTVLPESVREYLDDVAERTSESAATETDRERVAALAARATKLRREVDE